MVVTRLVATSPVAGEAASTWVTTAGTVVVVFARPPHPSLLPAAVTRLAHARPEAPILLYALTPRAQYLHLTPAGVSPVPEHEVADLLGRPPRHLRFHLDTLAYEHERTMPNTTLTPAELLEAAAEHLSNFHYASGHEHPEWNGPEHARQAATAAALIAARLPQVATQCVTPLLYAHRAERLSHRRDVEAALDDVGDAMQAATRAALALSDALDHLTTTTAGFTTTHNNGRHA